MINWTILEPYLYPSGDYDIMFFSGKIVLVFVIYVSASFSKLAHVK